jgi:uncharacterized protein YggT (Ycf19 family)
MMTGQDPGDNAFIGNLYRFLWQITEPLLKPLRGLIPSMRSGGGIQLDFSPVIAFLLLHLLRYIIETWVRI